MDSYRVSFYQNQIDQLTVRSTAIKKRHAVISIIRLLVFISMCISLSWILVYSKPAGIILGISFLLLFLYLIKLHRKIEEQLRHELALLSINKNELACCQGNFSGFDGGDIFINPAHPYSYDIDLFGPNSLFQYINRTTTSYGKKLLANWFDSRPLTHEQIAKHQAAVADLTERVSFRQDFQAAGFSAQTADDETNYIKDWLKQTSFFRFPLATKITLIGLPALTILALTGNLLSLMSINWFIAFSLLNLALIGFSIKEFNRRNQQLDKAHNHLQKMLVLLSLVENEPMKAPFTIELKQQLFDKTGAATRQVYGLTRLLNSLDNRNNIIVGVVLNSLLLWDWQCLWRIEKWQKQHQEHFEKWLETLACFDALNSLANMAYNNPGFNFPVIVDQPFTFYAEELGHLLIDAKSRVCNNLSLDDNGRFAIVTGANMAGKSTFLRTVAINIILAQCGAPVCARCMKLSPRKLFTSMRTEDSLSKHESYFFAELKRLQTITRQLDSNEDIFIILDEILRGTNSEDKRKGSIGFITKITRKKAYGLVATHDLELARLAASEPKIFKTMCFEVKIDGNQLRFDYKLAPGVTQNMNASFLMKQMGIMD